MNQDPFSGPPLCGGLRHDTARRPGGGGGVRRQGLPHPSDGAGQAAGILPHPLHSGGLHPGHGPAAEGRPGDGLFSCGRSCAGRWRYPTPSSAVRSSTSFLMCGRRRTPAPCAPRCAGGPSTVPCWSGASTRSHWATTTTTQWRPFSCPSSLRGGCPASSPSPGWTGLEITQIRPLLYCGENLVRHTARRLSLPGGGEPLPRRRQHQAPGDQGADLRAPGPLPRTASPGSSAPCSACPCPSGARWSTAAALCRKRSANKRENLRQSVENRSPW